MSSDTKPNLYAFKEALLSRRNFLKVAAAGGTGHHRRIWIFQPCTW